MKILLSIVVIILIVAIATFTDNIVGSQKKWAYRRIICLYILWWGFSIEWKYGEQAKLFG